VWPCGGVAAGVGCRGFNSGLGSLPAEGSLPDADAALSDLYVAHVVDGEQTAIAVPSSASGRVPDLPAGGEVEAVGSAGGEGSWRAMLLPLRDGSQVVVAVPLDDVDATTRRLTLALLVAAAAVLLAMAAGGWWLLRLGLRPIAEVTKVADAIASGDRSRRVARVGRAGSGTEADHLAKAFNVMLDEQAATEARLRQFVADASHELRNPVAAIGGFADLWRQDPLLPHHLDDVMRRIGQESARMRILVEDLLLPADPPTPSRSPWPGRPSAGPDRAPCASWSTSPPRSGRGTRSRCRAAP
jgi:two-component system, OmpR family, sensor kinase